MLEKDHQKARNIIIGQFHFSIIFKLHSPCYPVNITFQGAATQLSHIFHVLLIKFKLKARYFVLCDVHM